MVIAVTIAALTIASGASADNDASTKGAAQALFDEARRLMTEGRTEVACTKFAQSVSLERALGAILNLALCWEKAGKTASAYASFLEAEGLALRDKDLPRAKLAREHAAELEPKLIRVDLRVGSATDGTVMLDGASFPRAAWGVPTPIDPGHHTIGVQAPGKKPWSRELDLQRPGTTMLVEVPALEDDKPSVPAPPVASTQAPPPPVPPKEVVTRNPWPGIALFAGSLAFVGVGSYFGARTFAAQAEAKGRCDAGWCDDRAAELLDDKARFGTFATIGIGVGVALAVAGVFVLTRPSRAASAAWRNGAVVW